MEAQPPPPPTIAPTNEAVKERWDQFSELYSENFRLWSSVAHQALVSALELDGGARVAA